MMHTRRLHTVAAHLSTAPVAEKSVESPVLAKLGAVERYKYVTGKEPLIQVRAEPSALQGRGQCQCVRARVCCAGRATNFLRGMYRSLSYPGPGALAGFHHAADD